MKGILYIKEDWSKEQEIQIADEFEFQDENGNTINARKIKIIKKKPKYPTTYKECCEVLGIYSNRNFVCDGLTHKASNYDLKLFSLLEAFKQLIICRDAYWKLYGEEKGLGKPWVPEYKTLVDNTYFTIHAFNGEIVNRATSHRNAILAFPTEEMRDAFYKNFKDLINECKELL